MTNVGTIFRKARSQMVEIDSAALSKLFYERFHMKEGDYFTLVFGSGRVKPYRILSVSDVFPNQQGGYTSTLHVAALLRNGRIGTGRSVMLVAAPTKRSRDVPEFSCLLPHDVVKVETSVQDFYPDN